MRPPITLEIKTQILNVPPEVLHGLAPPAPSPEVFCIIELSLMLLGSGAPGLLGHTMLPLAHAVPSVGNVPPATLSSDHASLRKLALTPD